MTTASLEHANISVSNPQRTAENLCDIFGWHIRWQGDATEHGYTIHVGTDDTYLAIYAQNNMKKAAQHSYKTIGALNHIGVVVDDLKAVEEKVVVAGFRLGEHYDYEPGERFYFYDHDNIEFEVVSYV
ncbi:MAG: VOC family protein [Rhodobacteraceae bacterium]|nr:VOC family protein [Paracoccaceae bacterium]